jgi:hypothetical protein
MRQSLLLGLSALSSIGTTVLVQDSPRQRLLNGLGLPANYCGLMGGKSLPFTPKPGDPNDDLVDSVGEDLDHKINTHICINGSNTRNVCV